MRRGWWSSWVFAAASLACHSGCNLLFPLVPGFGGPVGSTFETATAVKLDETGKTKLASSISGDKVDVYDLGEAHPGDHLNISVEARPDSLGRSLDPTAVLFDAAEDVVSLNDDANFSGGDFNSLIDYVVSFDTDHLYLGVARSYGTPTEGNYEAYVSIEHGPPPGRPAGQILLLQFGGGSINIPTDGTFQFGPFQGLDIDPAYADKTDQIKAKIVETVRQRYRNTGVTIVTSDDPPASGNVSVVYFGAFSSTKFGVSQDVDDSNRDCCDDGIVFTDDFDKPFATRPTPDGLAIAIGNVAAHEAGHLLGLNHVADVTDLMDTTGRASTLLGDQQFKTSPLDKTIFPFGKQNGPAILSRVVPR